MTDYLDGALGPDDRASWRPHLAECESCAEHLRQIRITVAVTWPDPRREDLAPAVVVMTSCTSTVAGGATVRPAEGAFTLGPAARRGRAA